MNNGKNNCCDSLGSPGMSHSNCGNESKSGCTGAEINFDSLSENFFNQFDPSDEFKDCGLFGQMRRDFSSLCRKIASYEGSSSEEPRWDVVVEEFFGNYKTFDKYTTCHLTESMKSEMKIMCKGIPAYMEKMAQSTNTRTAKFTGKQSIQKAECDSGANC